jgi:hypothetical protein
MAYSLAAAVAAVDLNKTQHPAHQKGRDSPDERTTITVHPRPMSSAPLDGTPVRLFGSVGSAIASFWTAERSRQEFGPGDYREGWFLLDDDAIELDEPTGWEPLTSDCAWLESETVSLIGATGEGLTCGDPLSARPITTTVLASMQIMIHRLLRSLVLGSA